MAQIPYLSRQAVVTNNNTFVGSGADFGVKNVPSAREPSHGAVILILLLALLALSLVAQPVLRTSPSLIPPRKPLRSQGPRRLTEKPPSAARNALPRTQMALNQLLRRCVHLLIIGAIDVVGQYKVA